MCITKVLTRADEHSLCGCVRGGHVPRAPAARRGRRAPQCVLRRVRARAGPLAFLNFVYGIFIYTLLPRQIPYELL